MTTDTISDRVQAILADVFGLDRSEIHANTSTDDIDEWDSFNAINILIALEGEFQVSLTPEDAADLVAVPLIAEALKERGAQ